MKRRIKIVVETEFEFNELNNEAQNHMALATICSNVREAMKELNGMPLYICRDSDGSPVESEVEQTRIDITEMSMSKIGI